MRANYSTLTSMFEAPFLLEGQAMQLLYAQAAQMLSAREGDREDSEKKPEPLAYFAFTPHAAALGMMRYDALEDVPAGSIAVHTVAGVMFPEDSYWTGPGTKTIGQRIQQADAHPNIVAHVGWFKTPGGSTMGLENFAGIIAATTKPFVGYAEQACSAGYWGISGSDRIVLAGKTAMCGSIGTMAEFMDFTGMFELMGIKVVSANATKSTNKNASTKAAIEGNIKPLQEEILDPLNEVFLSTVTENRAGKLDAKQQDYILSGALFIGQANLDMGLADQFGSLEDAIALAQQLADEAADSDATTSTTNNSMTSLFAKKLTLGAAAHALVANKTITDEQLSAANEEIATAGIAGAQLITEAAYNDLMAKAGRADAAEATAQGFTDALAKAGATDIAALVKQRDDYKVKADKFDKAPGAGHTQPNLEAGATDIDKDEPTADQKTMDGLAHNKALSGHPMFG